MVCYKTLVRKKVLAFVCPFEGVISLYESHCPSLFSHKRDVYPYIDALTIEIGLIILILSIKLNCNIIIHIYYKVMPISKKKLIAQMTLYSLTEKEEFSMEQIDEYIKHEREAAKARRIKSAKLENKKTDGDLIEKLIKMAKP